MPTPGSTTARGYGWAHRKRVAELHHSFVEGTPCRRCGEPMYRSQYLDGGHPEGADPRIDLPDQLEHRYCNRRAGQATAQRRRNTSIFKQSRRWLA